MSDFFLQIILWIYNNIAFQNLGVAIIEISILSRIVFYPIMSSQIRYGKRMQELQPEIEKLKKRHGTDKQAFATAQMALFKQNKINPAAGCLPSLIQIVIMFGLLGALNQILTMNLNTSFWIWDMAKPDAYNVGLPFGLPGILVILAAATQFIQTRMMMPVQPPKIYKEDRPKEKQEKVEVANDLASMQSSMMWMFPLMFLVFGIMWPAGLALYWAIGSVLMIAQQYFLSGWGGLSPFIEKLGIMQKHGK